MGLLDLTTVAITRETKPIKGWVYRLLTSDRGTVIHRVPEDARFWGHGVIKQIYQQDTKRFVPAFWPSIDVWMDEVEAFEAIINYKEAV